MVNSSFQAVWLSVYMYTKLQNFNMHKALSLGKPYLWEDHYYKCLMKGTHLHVDVDVCTHVHSAYLILIHRGQGWLPKQCL